MNAFNMHKSKVLSIAGELKNNANIFSYNRSTFVHFHGFDLNLYRNTAM